MFGISFLPSDHTGLPQRLIAAMADGDRAALRSLYRTHATGIWWEVAVMLPDSDDWLPVTKAVFLEAWQMAGRFDPGCQDAAAWLGQITARRVTDRLHRRRGHQGQPEDACTVIVHEHDRLIELELALLLDSATAHHQRRSAGCT